MATIATIWGAMQGDRQHPRPVGGWPDWVWLYPPMADILRKVEFIETPTFARLLASLLTDQETAVLREFVKEL